MVEIGLSYYYFIITQSQNQNSNSIFEGAYASYYGETKLVDQTIGMQLREEIVNLNSTHARIMYYMKIESNSLEKIYEQQDMNWVSLNDPSYAIEDMIFLNKQPDYVFIPNLGTKYCMVYEYKYKAGTGLDGTMTVYADERSGWAYQFDFSFNISDLNFSMQLPLEDTNIPALR